MKYTMILWPHSNARYRSETLKLAKSELNVMFARVAPEAEVSGAECLDLPAISIQTAEPLSENALRAIQRASLLYGLFETRPDGAMIPVIGRERAYLGEDLPGVLKYKGKTNDAAGRRKSRLELHGNRRRQARPERRRAVPEALSGVSPIETRGRARIADADGQKSCCVREIHIFGYPAEL